jgi:hypothetical protein
MESTNYKVEFFKNRFKGVKRVSYQAEIRPLNGSMLVLVSLIGDPIKKRHNGERVRRAQDYDMTISMSDTDLLIVSQLEELTKLVKDAQKHLIQLECDEEKERQKASAKRKIALSKLSDEDREALGIRV